MTPVMGHRSIRAVRLLVTCAMVAGIVVAGSPAHACSCVEMDLSIRLPDADGAFVGTSLGREALDEQTVAITFEVRRVIRGDFGPTAIVRTNAAGASCGLEFLDGPRTGLLLDRAADGVWESDLCSMVPASDLLAVQAGALPDPAVDVISAGSTFPWWPLALGALAVGGLVALRGRARRRPA